MLQEQSKVLEGDHAKLPYRMVESRVPSSQLRRLWEYGSLATSMAFGAVGEGIRRATEGSGSSGGSLMFTPGNMERLVTKLSKMRGAALKLGQVMSFQGSCVVALCSLDKRLTNFRLEDASGTDSRSPSTRPRSGRLYASIPAG